MNRLIELGKNVIRKLIKNGYQGYFVGGSVRDLLLNRNINDIDIATDALTDDIIKLFPKVIPTGLKHGTVTIISNNLPIEVTTFRKEGNYLDYRHPENVEFVTNLHDDLGRRDFTMNAMAMDEKLNIIDPYNGRGALNDKLIITVGSPNERFQEDPLRMLRAIRFASQLNFAIDHLTWHQLIVNIPYLKYIAVERVKLELDKIICSDNPSLGFDLIKASGLLKWIKGLSSHNFEKNINYYSLLNKTDDNNIRWFLFLKPFNTKERINLMDGLKFSNKEISINEQLFNSYLLLKSGLDNDRLKKCLVENDLSICLKATYIASLLGEITKEEHNIIIERLNDLDRSIFVRNRKDLKISGSDLIHHFSEPGGPWVKELLDKLLELVIYHQEENEFSSLLNKAIKIRKESVYEGKN